MDLAGFFREKTKAAEWGSQHHALKICFGRSHYGNQVIFEKMVNATRVDILLLEDMKIIEVKTLSDVSPDDVLDVTESVWLQSPPHPDILWIFFFEKISPPKAEHNLKCQYLLVHIWVDLLGPFTEEKMEALIRMVEESNEAVAKKLEIPRKWILPLENLVKVEDLERLVEERDQRLKEQDQRLKVEKKANQELKRQLKAQDQQLKTQDQQLKAQGQEIALLKKELENLAKKLK
jgi:hypothetical protein